MIGWLWTNGLAIPMTNLLVLLSRLAFGSFGLAIIIFTLLMRGITWPLTQAQLRSTRAMQAVQPRIQEIQKKYKDPQRRSEETMKLYRESGVNPLGCIWPMVVQMPIWIALYQSIRFTLGSTPESVVELSQRLYPWTYLRTAVPLENHFLGLDMGATTQTQGFLGIVLAVLVGVSMWVQQRMTTPANPSMDPQQQSMNNMMLWMMPLMFGWFTLQFPAGLALYWVATSVVSIGLQYMYMGPGNFDWRRIFSLRPSAAPGGQQAETPTGVAAGSQNEEEEEAEQAYERSKRRRRRRRGRRRKR